MSWRVVYIETKAKVSYKNGYMVVRGDTTNMIHLSEIHTVIFDSMTVILSAYLIVKLTEMKIKIIFCDERHNPSVETLQSYGSHNSSKRIAAQVEWDIVKKVQLWQDLIKEKIRNQSRTLRMLNHDEWEMLENYADAVLLDDTSNREGHAAKVYFNALYADGENRRDHSLTSSALNYGYAIIASTISKEIVASGYLTQIGIKHHNEFNDFNLTYDLIEPLRFVVDDYVFTCEKETFDADYRKSLVNLINHRFIIEGKNHSLKSCIRIYLRSIFKYLNGEDDLIKFLEGTDRGV